MQGYDEKDGKTDETGKRIKKECFAQAFKSREQECRLCTTTEPGRICRQFIEFLHCTELHGLSMSC